ncbi:uncharacterized protein LOC119351342 [Triticum dicoccoides]|uniref:uncharacterized protein LOC119351342 n=1 Tax=Triticum dicoccoides TaxID=85692 RepID=UPI00188EDB79|nr:uncharacterized protein LOC119351342 [Triticum dicoccoides]
MDIRSIPTAGAIDSDRARRSTYSLSVSSFFSFSGKPSRPPIPFPLSIPSSTAAALLPPPRRGASRAPRGQRGSRARTSAAREVANTARRRARTSTVRSKCSSSQYGEAQRLHGLREVQGRKQPIRRAVPVRRPYGLRGVLDLAPTPPTRAGPPPGRRPHPHHQAPQRRPRLGVASEDFQGAAQGWRFWQLCSDDAVRAQLARFQHEEEDDLTGSSTTCLFCFSVASYSINTEHYARKSAAAIVQESNYCMNSEHLQRNCCSFGSMPEAGLTDSPLFLHPQHVQINTEAPCRSQRLAKYNTTTSF